MQQAIGKPKLISIHALVKRATKGSHSSLCNCGDFNPRPRKEGDKKRYTDKRRVYNFNPRPRKEGDTATHW